jgi:colicin import membrane protein
VFAVLKRNPVALVLAILLHIGLALFLILEVDWGEAVKPIGGDVKVVQATLVDHETLEAAERAEQEQVAAAKRAEQQALEQRRAEEKRKLAAIENERKAREQDAERKAAEERKRVEAEKVRVAELQRKEAEQKKKQEAEKKRLAELEEKRQADEKRRKEEEARKAAEAEERKRAEAAAKEKAEAERKAAEQAKAEAERKRKAAAEAKAKADREAREAELAAQYAAEQDASELAAVVGRIRSKVERNWLRPPGTGEQGLRCTVRVRLGGSGSVLLVSVVKSSGNAAFDRSVEAAVRKADPLPMPTSQTLLSKFREIEFVFEPSN